MSDFTEREQQYVDKLTSVYQDLFMDLRKQGYVKKIPTIIQLKSIRQIIHTIDNFSLAYNAINTVFQAKRSKSSQRS